MPSSQPVFTNKNDDKLNPRGLHKIFKEILEKAGLPLKRFSLHHLRHTFSTLLLQENKDNVDSNTEKVTRLHLYLHAYRF
ncbi:tyrosine-type recombinase/integrase [Thermolongibacillus altinsuensis]|jgi:site-specific recombinase XerD